MADPSAQPSRAALWNDPHRRERRHAARLRIFPPVLYRPRREPRLRPLSQVFIVLIFAEISPLFAGRRYAEHVAMLGVPIIYFTSIS